jgi:hypothetical protein
MYLISIFSSNKKTLKSKDFRVILSKKLSNKNIFFHPDFTVGIGIAPIQPVKARGLYRRLGISPDPEDLFNLIIDYHNIV